MPAGLFWRVTSGGQYCQVTNGGSCVTDGAGNYGNNERCVVRATQALVATATEFVTEVGWDYVTLGGAYYSGTTGPSNVAMAAGETFTWSSDRSNVGTGWTICGPPPPSPPSSTSSEEESPQDEESSQEEESSTISTASANLEDDSSSGATSIGPIIGGVVAAVVVLVVLAIIGAVRFKRKARMPQTTVSITTPTATGTVVQPTALEAVSVEMTTATKAAEAHAAKQAAAEAKAAQAAAKKKAAAEAKAMSGAAKEAAAAAASVAMNEMKILFDGVSALGIGLVQLGDSVGISSVAPTSAAAAVPLFSNITAINGKSCAGKSKGEVVAAIGKAKAAGAFTMAFAPPEEEMI